MKTVWRLLVVLRIALTLLPQTGYIHPDEFFQSVEVVAGDVLDLRVQLPWEFNSTLTKHPIRNVLIPYLVAGVPLYFLKCLSELSDALLDVTLLSPYLMLVLPRLYMAFLSLCADSFMCRVCRLFKRNHVRAMCVYASSQVVLVFLTRTLSNSIESFLFAAMLAMVSEDIYDVDQRTSIKRSKTIKNRKDDNHQDNDIDGDASNSLRKSNWLGAITAVGLFNRPTFLAFAFVPLSIWMLYGIEHSPRHRRIFSRCLSLAPSFLVTCSLLIMADTLYYGQHYSNAAATTTASTVLLRWDLLLNIRWVFTPVNFIAYNLSKQNLLKHGLHPRYVHLLVNNVLLFGVLGIVGLADYARMLFRAFVERRQRSNATTIHIMDKMCACGFVFPILILSFAPHQEARFIEPVVFPLVFLHADKLYGSSPMARLTRGSWIVLNLVGSLFFGFLHQGGVVPSLVHLQRSSALASVDHAIYFHTYMPPTSLLLLRSKHHQQQQQQHDCSVQPEKMQIHDLMGAPLEELHRKMDRLRGTVLVVSPTSLRDEVRQAVQPFQPSLHTRFWMHISMEDPPPLDASFLDRIGLDMHLVDVWKNVTRVQYLSSA